MGRSDTVSAQFAIVSNRQVGVLHVGQSAHDDESREAQLAAPRELFTPSITQTLPGSPSALLRGIDAALPNKFCARGAGRGAWGAGV